MSRRMRWDLAIIRMVRRSAILEPSLMVGSVSYVAAARIGASRSQMIFASAPYWGVSHGMAWKKTSPYFTGWP